MKKWVLTILIGTAMVLAACGGGDEGGSDEQQDNGNGTEESSDGGSVDTASAEEVYESNCASCHGADLSGGAGPDLTQVGSKYSADEILDIINNGKGTMPPGLATGDDADALANWLAEKK